MSASPVAIRRLILSDFRSYAAVDLAVDATMIAVTGENGSGKTNLIEAISLFAQGRGLRRADLAACTRHGSTKGFVASLELMGEAGGVQLGTGLEREGEASVRRFRIDREPVGSARGFADHVRLVWLTPAMDGLFNGAPGDRRRFLDRLVLAVDAGHGTRVAALERGLRQRNRVLEQSFGDTAWLDAIEREVAELAVAVAAARQDTVARLGDLLAARADGAFPRATIGLVGEIEALCADHAALVVEDRYRAMLRASRAQDRAAGRALVGPQAADLTMVHADKGVAAQFCSTGEQKALLVGLVLAHARLVGDLSGLAPVILLDEIAAHFDLARRRALFAELRGLGSQVWMTGADLDAFAGSDALALRVGPSGVAAIT